MTDKQKRLKREQEERRKKNKLRNTERIVSYEEFIREIQKTELKQEEWLIYDSKEKNTIKYILDNIHNSDIPIMRETLKESIEGLIKICEKLYTPILKRNQELIDVTKESIVNYYKNKFEIRMSREISFLPLELRLLIYLELLKVEQDDYYIVNLLERVTLTLGKMQADTEYKSSVFILSWAEIILFLTSEPHPVFKFFQYRMFEETYTDKFSKILNANAQMLADTSKLRNRTLDTAMLTETELLDKEFWYGVNAFKNVDNLRDMNAAMICIDLFTIYFKKIFLCVTEFKEIILEYYKTGRKTKLEKFLKEHQLEEIDMKSYKNSCIAR